MATDIWSLKHKITGHVYDITKSVFKVGRNISADITSLTNSLSRNHANLSILIDGSLNVQDLKSCNGTFVNDEKIQPMEMRLLNHGDVVGFGCSEELLKDFNFETTPLLFTVIKKDDAPVEITIQDITDEADEEREENKENEKEREKDEEKKDEQNENQQEKNAENIKVEKDPLPLQLKNEFSEEPDCILVSDSDDDCDMFSNSQIFKITEHVKKEQTDTGDAEEVDPYYNIKQELEDLDFCDFRQAAVDLTSEEGQVNNTEDLLQLLESDTVENCQQSTSSSNVTTSSQPKHNYTKPPIIEPHFETTSSTPKNKATTDPEPSTSKKTKMENKSTTKRKSSVTSPHVPKKSRTVKSPKNPTNKQSILEEFNKRNAINSSDKKKLGGELKTQIVEERKKRLKELSNSKKRGSTTEKHEKQGIAKVKNSESRGTFLLENVSTQKNHKNSTADIKTKISGSKDVSSRTKTVTKQKTNVTRTSLPHKDASKQKYNKTNIKTTSNYRHSLPSTSRTDPEDDSIQDTTISSNFSPTFEDPRSRQDARPSDNLRALAGLQNPDSTDNDNSTSFIFGLAANLHKSSFRNRQRTVSIEDSLCRIVGWSVNWLLEQKGMDVSPPVNGKEAVLSVPLRFVDSAQYVRLFTGLVMLELWQYVYQSLYSKGEERSPIKVFLNHQRTVGKLTYLDCEYYMSNEEDRRNVGPRIDDLALIEIKLKDTNNHYVFSGFAYVKSNRRKFLNNGTVINKDVAAICSGKPSVSMTFSIVTKHLPREVAGKVMLLKVIANISNSLRLLKSVKYVETSPLCKNVLSPRLEDFQVPCVEEKLLVEANVNKEQRQIVLEVSALCSSSIPRLYLIRGPPGTGKSTVIVNIVVQILLGSVTKEGREPPLILLTAPTNTAIDGLVLKLAETRKKLKESDRKHIKMVRLGPESSISPQVESFKLSSLARNNILKDQHLLSSTAFKEAMEKGVSGDRFLRDHLGHNYHYHMRCAEDLLLFRSNIVCTTLNSCVGSKIMEARRRDKLKFTCCIVDEATQCTEPESLLPVQLGIDKIVLVGDPQQLPAMVCNKEAQSLGYGRSLFGRIDDNFKSHPDTPIRMLCEQYRMRKEICEYPNKKYYAGKLRSFPIHANRIVPELKPYLLFNLATLEKDDNVTYTNTEEANLVYTLLKTLESKIGGNCKYSIGIITPYRAQRELLLQKVADIKFNKNVSIMVNTVDSFQGMENDIVLISSVRYTPNCFLENEQRLNVALTRARQALYVIGNYSLFKHCRPLYDLREDAKRRKLCLDIKENFNNVDYSKYLFKT